VRRPALDGWRIHENEALGSSNEWMGGCGAERGSEHNGVREKKSPVA
jgi:hypothetical protein